MMAHSAGRDAACAHDRPARVLHLQEVRAPAEPALQVPARGDYITTSIAGTPVIMVRAEDGDLRVLENRCAHKGGMLVSRESGSVGKFFRCPYHAWSYQTDGTPIAVPLKDGYKGTRMRDSSAAQGLAVIASAIHRGFVFARLAADGPAFDSHFGAISAVLDNLAERSPLGQLHIAGGCLRSVIDCNWKIYLENINDGVHPVSTHESVARAARDAAKALPAGQPMPMALEQLLPFGAGYEFFVGAGVRVYPHGHSIFGTRASIHSGYGDLPDYVQAMEAAHGADRAREILAFAPQNSVFFPSLVVKNALQTLRVIRPLAVDRTLIVAHDDIHVFQTVQCALAANANPWVSLHREHVAGESSTGGADTSGTSEWPMRNQYQAWAALMTPHQAQGPA